MRVRSERGFGTGAILFLVVGIIVTGAAATVVVKQSAPKFLRAKQRGNEASAIGSLRAIHSAQAIYAANCGNGFYAPSLTALAARPGTTEEPFVVPALAAAETVTKDGYTITMRSTEGALASAPASCNGLPSGTLVTGYVVTATPEPDAGLKAYGLNTSGTIYEAEQTTPLEMSNRGVPTGATALQ